MITITAVFTSATSAVTLTSNLDKLVTQADFERPLWDIMKKVKQTREIRQSNQKLNEADNQL